MIGKNHFSSYAARDAFEAESDWADRNLPATIHDSIRHAANKWGERNALSFQLFSGPKDKAQTLSWQDVHDKSIQLANLFRSLGVDQGDAVAYMLPNTNETVLTFLGGMMAGIVNPINPLLEAEQIADILKETGAKVLVTLKPTPNTDLSEKAALAADLAPLVTTILEVDLTQHLPMPKRLAASVLSRRKHRSRSCQTLDFNKEMGKQGRQLEFDDPKRDRVTAYFHTGGTTGHPKIVQHYASSILYNAWLGEALMLDEHSIAMCPLPLFHVFGCHAIIMSAVLSGAHVILPTPAGYRGDGVIENFWKLIERWEVTFVITVPTALSALMQRPVDADISSVQLAFSGSAPLPTELYRRFKSATNIEIAEGYGLTEATALVSGNPVGGIKKVGSVGIPFPYTDIKIALQEETGWLECDANQVGEICVKSPGIHAENIYTDEELNSEIHTPDNYLRTGDLGRIDEDGYLWITGRAKDLIIRGGHNIDPTTIEEAIALHPSVEMVGAVGQPDRHAGEIPCAYVSLLDQASVSAKELLEHAHAHIGERAAWPKHIEIIDQLPKTAVGKVSKLELKQMAIARIYDQALQEAGLDCHVSHVRQDSKSGPVAVISTDTHTDEEHIQHALGHFTNRWVLNS